MPTFHINRSTTLAALLQGKGWTPAERGVKADFAMWFPPRDSAYPSQIGLFDIEVTRVIDDKLRMYKLLVESGLQALSPPTFDSLPSYLKYQKDSGQEVFCFLKLTHESGGAGVWCFNSLKLLIDHLTDSKQTTGNALLQQGIKHPLLLDGRKFKIRAYALATREWKCYLFEQILVVMHEKPYSPEDVSPGIQISPSFNDRTTTLDKVSLLSGFQGSIEQAVRDSLLALARETRHCENLGHYHLFGYDFVCDEKHGLYLIEVNGFPGFERTDNVGSQVSENLMADLKTLVVDPMVFGKHPVCGRFKLL